MSFSTTLAEYYSTGNITLPGATASGKNAISDNKQSSYAWTSGSTNTYVSVSVTFYFVNYSGDDFRTETKYGSTSPYIRKDASPLVSGFSFYKVKSTHTASSEDDSGSITLTTIP